ncbi:MAG TPA: toll/interleukin-1 receptor domain-containing protein [Stellaceae bacterium]|nr:toll/interleukin-1 receptor domain-containing protein [Stellaceae bacterium]
MPLGEAFALKAEKNRRRTLAIQIFISYAREDDRLPTDSKAKRGFVSHLCGEISYEFSQRGRSQVRIWRDTVRIERGDDFDKHIRENLRASDILLIVLSNNWIASEWCKRELDVFAKCWQHEGMDRVRKRVLFVTKHFMSRQAIPALLNNKEGFEFSVIEEGAGAGSEDDFFDPRAETQTDRRYFDRARDLARRLLRLAQELSSSAEVESYSPVVSAANPASDRAPSSSSSAVTASACSTRQALTHYVYLAKPAADMREAYCRVIAELQGRDIRIVPDPNVEVPHDATAAAVVDEWIAGAAFSVHLLGDKLGYAPEDAPHIVPLQLAHAAARAAATTPAEEPPFHRLVWAPRVFAGLADPAAERDPLAVLERFDGHLSTDKVEGDDLSRFVDFLVQHTARATAPTERPERIEAETRYYVYHREEDTDYACAVSQRLQELEIDAVLPAFEGDPGEINALHRENLRECDGVVLCWANAPEVWVRATARELGRWRELGRKENFAVRGLIAAPPPGKRKQVIIKVPPRNEIDVVLDLTDRDDLPPEALNPLIIANRERAL